MRIPGKILALLFSIWYQAALSLTAPVTTIGVVTNAVPGNSFTMPVTVTGFINVAQFTLTLNYSTTNLTYTGYLSNPAFPSITVTHSSTGTLGKIQVSFAGVGANFTLPDFSTLVSFNFTYLTGTSYLTWNYANSSGNICRYKTYSGGSYVNMSDDPKSTFYIHGGIGYRGAPVVSLPSISNAAPGTIAVPVTVTSFDSIQVFNLNLEYDQNVLTYQNIVYNAIFPVGSIIAGAAPGVNGKYVLTINCVGSGNYELPDGSTLLTINFAYSQTNGTWSELNWYDNGSSCDFSSSYTRLIDMPSARYYHNGKIYTQAAPAVTLPAVAGALPFNSIAIPVETTGFANIYSFTLSFEYDTAALIYLSFTPNPGLSSMTVTNNAPVGSKRKLSMTWSGSSPKSFPDGTSLAEINFTAKNAPTGLTWVTGDATSCRFNNAAGKSLFDMPKTDHYMNGMMASRLGPLVICGQQQASGNQQVQVPVTVYGFYDVGYFSLVLDYDFGVLTYQGAALVPNIGGTFIATNPVAGRISLNWSGSANSVSDNSTLINLTFQYSSGSSSLVWYDNGSSCRMAASITDSAYYDKPKADFYYNGYVGPSPLVANFTCGNLLPPVNETITLTDLSAGSPESWSWSISPETFEWMNGTGATSQHPQVKFTANGAYDVTLKVYRGILINPKIMDEYLHAGIPGLWTGFSSSVWTEPSNWHNYMVPTGATVVVIPSSASNWPVIGQALVIGTDCSGLTVEEGAELFITGSK